MTDIVDPATRSRMMSNIRSSNTKPEILVRKALHSLGYRYRLDTKIGRINPDIILRSNKVAIFVHGCYWHQHEGCKLAYSDRNYSEKWRSKFRDNKTRDAKTSKSLLDSGWRVGIFWACITRNPELFAIELDLLRRWINSGESNSFETRLIISD